MATQDPLTRQELADRYFFDKEDGKYCREFSDGWSLRVIFGEQSPTAFIEFWHKGTLANAIHDVKTVSEFTELVVNFLMQITPL